jgi:hypothetical protein
MDVRLARPTDAPLALALALDESAHLVKSFGWPATNRVSRTILGTVLPPMALPGRIWIARDQHAVALLEARPRRYVIGWDVNRLVVRGDGERVLGPVLAAAIDHLRRRGVPRLFARCGDTAADYLKSAGFHALAREYVLVGSGGTGDSDEPLSVDSRYRMPQDAWPLHQLESEVTPPLVRQLEGLTSLDWSTKIRGMSEIVIERDGHVIAWIGWGVRLGQGFTQLGMLIHPDHADVAPQLLHHALQTSPTGTRFIARVRDYQTEALQTFTDAGFTLVAEEILMLKAALLAEAPSKMRLKVASVPGMHAFNRRLYPTPPEPIVRIRLKELS